MISKCQSKRTLLQRKYLESQGIPWLSCYSWEQRKVGEVSKRVIVGLATSVTPYYREEGVPILRNLNIKENYLDDTDILFLDRPYAESQVSKQIHAGDVLTVHTGYIGISCVVPEKYDNCLTFTTLITTTDDAVLEGAFLAQYLNSEIGMSAVQAVTTQGGRQNLNTNDFVKVEIRYPSLAEQSKICAVLSRIDNLITLHQRQRKNSMRNCSCLPFSWEQRKLGECFSERVESDPNGELISVTIGSGIKKFSELGRHDNSNDDKSKYKKVVVGDIAYNSMRMWQGASGYSPYNGIVSPAYTVITPFSGIDSKFFAYMFKREDMIHTFQIRSQGITSDNWNLKFPTLSEIPVMLPITVEEQTAIAGYLTILDTLITLHQREQIFINLEVHDVRSGKKHRFIL